MQQLLREFLQLYCADFVIAGLADRVEGAYGQFIGGSRGMVKAHPDHSRLHLSACFRR